MSPPKTLLVVSYLWSLFRHHRSLEILPEEKSGISFFRKDREDGPLKESHLRSTILFAQREFEHKPRSHISRYSVVSQLARTDIHTKVRGEQECFRPNGCKEARRDIRPR